MAVPSRVDLRCCHTSLFCDSNASGNPLVRGWIMKGDLPQATSHGTSIAQNFTGAQQRIYILMSCTHKHADIHTTLLRERTGDGSNSLLILNSLSCKDKI